MLMEEGQHAHLSKRGLSRTGDNTYDPTGLHSPFLEGVMLPRSGLETKLPRGGRLCHEIRGTKRAIVSAALRRLTPALGPCRGSLGQGSIRSLQSKSRFLATSRPRFSTSFLGKLVPSSSFGRGYVIRFLA